MQSLKLYPLLIFLWICALSRNETVYNKLLKNELLQPEDLYENLNALHRIVLYEEQVLNNNDASKLIGIFSISVNLKWALIRKPYSIPKAVKQKIEQILTTSHRILQDVFKTILSNGNSTVEELEKNVSTLFKDDRSWLLNMKSFRANTRTAYKSRRVYDKDNTLYKSYAYMVFNYDFIKPQPFQSDLCLEVISKNSVNFEVPMPQCLNINEKCNDILRNGSPYGYAITHRLLWLIAAHFSRGCLLLSQKEDEALIEDFCEKIYNEAEYIASHDFELSDLIFEQIGLCSIKGYSNFFRRSWFWRLLEFQTPYGCMKAMNLDKMIASKDDFDAEAKTRLRHLLSRFNDRHDTCNHHVTVVAAGAISSAVRYIIDIYY